MKEKALPSPVHRRRAQSTELPVFSLPEVSEQLGAHCLSGTARQMGTQSYVRIALQSPFPGGLLG